MMSQILRADPKYKKHVSAAGHLIYIDCDGTAKEIIQQAEKNTVLTLKRYDRDATPESLVEKIIDVISKESPTDAFRAEVKVLSQIIACTRKTDDKPRYFHSEFSGLVGKYVNLTYIQKACQKGDRLWGYRWGS